MRMAPALPPGLGFGGGQRGSPQEPLGGRRARPRGMLKGFSLEYQQSFIEGTRIPIDDW